MAKFIKYEPCPRCVSSGRDRRGDNLGVYDDGSSYCFSCGYHRKARHSLRFKEREEVSDDEKAVLPSDFTREVPSEGWKWLLQYGLPYSYWKPYTGYSPSHNRLVLTFGQPVKFSIGRALEKDQRKWRFWGDGHKYAELLGKDSDRPIVLVEDLISAHKVGQFTQTLCLFGTHIHDVALKVLIEAKKPVILWLDEDQYTLLPKKVARLSTFLKHPVRFIRTDKDPKEYDMKQIEEYLK
ncbi:MAG: hypothetical protein ACK5PF_04965 [bacterium]